MSRVAAALVALIVLLTPVPSRALFHFALIDEVMSRVGGDASKQYVEIRMLTSLQEFVKDTRLTAFNCDGSSYTVLLLVPANVGTGGMNVRWIMATTNPIGGIAPDFIMSPGIPADCGMVCWGAPGTGTFGGAGDPNLWDPSDPNQYTDCVAYGGYSGTTKTVAGYVGGPTSGTPSNLPAGDGVMSLTRTSSTNSNIADFSLLCPTPTNNAGAMGSFGTCTPADLAGRVTTGTGAGKGGVTITLSGAASGSLMTDSAGHYTFTGLANGTYTVTPSKSGCTFNPVSRMVTISGGVSAAGQSFTASGGCC